MKDASQTLQLVLDMIERIHERPLMYGGDGVGANLILYHYHSLWAEIVERREEFEAVLKRDIESQQCCVKDFAGHYRECIRSGEATEGDVARYVVSRWKAIGEKLESIQ